MKKIKEIILGEVWTGFSVFEKCFLIGMLVLQCVVYIIAPDSIIGIISGISGVISVVLCAKGKISFYFIGFVQTITYLILAWQNQFYGEVIENLFYFVTMVWGIFVWLKHSSTHSDGTKYVESQKMSGLQWVLSIVGTIISTFLMGMFLTRIGSAQAYTDAATNVFAIFAQLLMVRRYREQWIWWLLINLFCIKLWIVAGNWSMVAMYMAWTVNCIYGWINWTKLNKEQHHISV